MNAVGWFEIYVDEMERAANFYEKVFATKLEKMQMPEGSGDMEMRGFKGEMTNYGANGSLVKMPGLSAGNNSVIVYFGCDDCLVEEGRVLANGGKIKQNKSSIGEYGFMSLVYDTEGNMIGLHSMK